MLITIFDTETSGLPKPGLPDPYIMELAFAVCDTRKRRVLMSAGFFLNEEAMYEVHPDAYRQHKLTREQCNLYGVNKLSAFRLLNMACNMTGCLAAYNYAFDGKLMNLELARLGDAADGLVALGSAAKFDIMAPLTPVINLPPNPGFSTPKWPKLIEAHRHLLLSEFQAHAALDDVMASFRVVCVMEMMGIELKPME